MTVNVMAGDIAIRAATVEDAAVLSSLAAQLGYPTTPDQIVSRLKEIVSHRRHVIAIAEMPNGVVVGWIEAFVYCCLATGETLEIAGLIVDEDFRGQGNGRLLMGHIEKWGRDNGCSVAALRSNVIRESAHRFYECIGYHHMKTQKNFCKSL